jgi:hypothetical protein
LLNMIRPVIGPDCFSSSGSLHRQGPGRLEDCAHGQDGLLADPV